MITTTLWDLRDRVRGKAHLWLLDNSASLHARIRGTSSNSIWAEQWSCLACFVTGLSLMSGLCSLIAALTNQTEAANDGDPYCQQLGIQPYECFVYAWMWTESLTQVWASFRGAALGDSAS